MSNTDRLINLLDEETKLVRKITDQMKKGDVDPELMDQYRKVVKSRKSAFSSIQQHSALSENINGEKYDE